MGHESIAPLLVQYARRIQPVELHYWYSDEWNANVLHDDEGNIRPVTEVEAGALLTKTVRVEAGED